MGLDMHLNATRYLAASRYENGEFVEVERPSLEGYGFALTMHQYKVHTWRKFAPLHNFIVEHIHGGEDDCSMIPIDSDACDQIIDFLRTDFDTSEEANSGFFFGDEEWWQELKANRDEHIEIFKRLKKFLQDDDPEGAWRDAHYQSSW